MICGEKEEKPQRTSFVFHAGGEGVSRLAYARVQLDIIQGILDGRQTAVGRGKLATLGVKTITAIWKEICSSSRTYEENRKKLTNASIRPKFSDNLGAVPAPLEQEIFRGKSVRNTVAGSCDALLIS